MQAKKLELSREKLLELLRSVVDLPEDAKIEGLHYTPGLTTATILITSGEYPALLGNDYLFYAQPLAVKPEPELELIEGEKVVTTANRKGKH